MTDTYKDLDALVPTDKQVKLGGITYDVPGDIPLEIFVRVSKASELEDDDEVAAMDEMVAALTDLFAFKSKDRPEESSVRETVTRVLRGRGVQFITQLLRNVYNDGAATPVEGDEGKSPTSSGTPTTST